MIKALLLGVGLLACLILYAFLGAEGMETVTILTGYAGFGLLAISIFMMGSTLGVDRITMATPDVHRNFIADESNDKMKKERRKEQRWAVYTLVAGIPSVLTWVFMYFLID
ncbi:hypothetical protein [Brevibacillus sp. SAFN-007a]|uniref:hypothetical protein n=1 Tax=Brevibacillus sp. SAFN-007a TaxID=3436862 RepID=UPI003F7F10EB